MIVCGHEIPPSVERTALDFMRSAPFTQWGLTQLVYGLLRAPNPEEAKEIAQELIAREQQKGRLRYAMPRPLRHAMQRYEWVRGTR